MKIYDISWPISSAMTHYKNKGGVTFTDIKSFAKDGVRETAFCLGAHTGTHVDAPSHFMKDGKTIDEIRLDRSMGYAKVLDFITVTRAVTAEDLAQYEIKEGEIILLRTANSALGVTDQFNKDFIYLDHSGAHYLAEKKVKAIGIDYLGIEHGDPEHATHIALMKADITIIEGLRLFHVPAGIYFLICLPLNLVGLEAAPARAILMSDQE
jgi:arylformamidase